MTATVAAPTGAPAARQSDQRPALRHRLAERGIDRTLVLLVPGVLFIVVLFVYPFLYGLQLSFQPQGGGGLLANYKAFFADSYQRDTIWLTLRLGLPAAVLNVVVSVPLAYAMRGAFRGKRTLTTLLVLPITLGTVLTADGLLNYLGPNGWFNRVLTGLHIVDQPVTLIHNYTGVFMSLIITGFPFAFLLTSSYLSGIDPSLDRAAATLGAPALQRFFKITLPLLMPGLAVTFCLSFVLAFSVFPSAQLVGNPSGSTHVISIAAYHAAFDQFDYSMGSAVAMIMAVVMLVIIGLVLAGRSRLYVGSTSGGKG
jgi:putative spermidine/putrescine transport system permease protein